MGQDNARGFMAGSVTITPQAARRLAIQRQYLAGRLPEATVEGIFDVVRDLGCLQLDPISAVARSHLLVLWSRFGVYDPGLLDTLLWDERRLFEYWAHCASIVLTDDYPLYLPLMQSHGRGESSWARTVRAFEENNHVLRDHILAELAEGGPLPSRQFEAEVQSGWSSTGWTSGRNVSRMIDILWISGRLMVAARKGGQKLWDLTERCLPDWTPREVLDPQTVVEQAAQRSLRALGVATPAHIKNHFIRGRYPGLATVLKKLEHDGRIVRVSIEDSSAWPEIWYVHADDLPLLERVAQDDWQGRTTLLSPFDNLICDRARAERLFDFRFRIEIYVPKARREYGYYVMPILHNDRLIGRIDPVMERTNKRLTVNSVYAEPNVPLDHATGQQIGAAVEHLATFLGASEIRYGAVPEGWKQGIG